VAESSMTSASCSAVRPDEARSAMTACAGLTPRTPSAGFHAVRAQRAVRYWKSS
jgi:hypothetical protein